MVKRNFKKALSHKDKENRRRQKRKADGQLENYLINLIKLKSKVAVGK